MGSYVNNNLLPNEEVIFETRHHLFHFFSLRGVFSLFILPLLDHFFNEFVITNQRIIIKRGILVFWSLEMNHSQIEAIFVTQSILGRIFNSGSIEISGTGGTREKFHQISNPLVFRRVFQETIANQ
jgi:uncharacterized membrane protein YdbT with pleckstrin-like domain